MVKLLRYQYTKHNNSSKFCVCLLVNKSQWIKTGANNWSMSFSRSSRLTSNTSSLSNIYSSSQMVLNKSCTHLNKFKWHSQIKFGSKSFPVKGPSNSKINSTKDRTFSIYRFSRWISLESWIRCLKPTHKKYLSRNHTHFHPLIILKISSNHPYILSSLLPMAAINRSQLSRRI